MPSFKSDAPEEVELTLFDSGEYLTLNAVSVDERPIARINPKYTVAVKTDVMPKAVKLLPDGDSVPFEYENGYVKFTAREFKCFDAYMIEK